MSTSSARSATTSIDEAWRVLRTRGTNTDDVEHVQGGKTFFWSGVYSKNLNTRETLVTELNVFEHFEPKLSEASAGADVLFLANIQPELQSRVREQCSNARFVAMDSMDLWINIAHGPLVEVIRSVDCVILNDEELEMLTGEPLVRAAKTVLSWGPTAVVAKQGKYGAALFTADGFFALPGYPLDDVADPTGAGDTFAGGFVGYVAAHRDRDIDHDLLRGAMAYGTALASFNVEEFGTERVARLSGPEITARVEELAAMTTFAPDPLGLRG